ncbi:hypothetical protein [Microvirga solisilvae]|uniref:hypothetical protein n=1 Tax=Microvirga solisilvae TaxID=2919498 RepID=UPI001FAFD2A0|nr:hypothetical protein [Microvirga solisilvae]
MQAGRLLTSVSFIVALCAGGTMALAQGARPWIDPPSETGRSSPTPSQAQPLKLPPVSPTPAPAPPQQAQPPQAASPPASSDTQPKSAERPSAPQDEKRRSRAASAKDFAIDYLASWSARNDIALSATAELYAPRILYHGRTVSLERLYKEKQRFIQRWPEREYRPREDAIGTQCNPDGTICTIHAVFDYSATNPKRRRISEGSGALQLIVEFIGQKPVIVAEHSTLLTQSRRRILASEGSSHE